MTVVTDQYWLDAAAFVRGCDGHQSSLIAPRDFEQLVPTATPIDRRLECPSPEVVVLHKGQLEALGPDVIESLISGLNPSFANEVFVVFTRKPASASVAMSAHFVAFKQALGALRSRNPSIRELGGKQRMALYLGDHIALTKTIYGHKMYVDTRDISLAPHILLDGSWEPWITQVFRDLVRPGMKVIDVGANIGWYSVIAAEMIGSAGHLTAFEANPGTAALTYRNIIINGFQDRATVVQKAVYSESGPIEFKAYERFKGSSGLFGSAAAAAVFHDTVETLTVDAVALDEYLPSDARVDFIKMDAEGAEPYILRGARKMLERNKDIQIIMEFSPSIIRNAHGNVEDFCEEIFQLGFAIYQIKHDSSLSLLAVEEVLALDHCDVVLRR